MTETNTTTESALVARASVDVLAGDCVQVRCGKCRFWRVKGEANGIARGKCDNLSFHNEVRPAHSVPVLIHNFKIDPRDAEEVADVRTLSTFGCRHFEPLAMEGTSHPDTLTESVEEGLLTECAELLARAERAEAERDELKAVRKAMARLAEHLQLSGYHPESVVDNAIGAILRFSSEKREATERAETAEAMLADFSSRVRELSAERDEAIGKCTDTQAELATFCSDVEKHAIFITVLTREKKWIVTEPDGSRHMEPASNAIMRESLALREKCKSNHATEPRGEG